MTTITQESLDLGQVLVDLFNKKFPNQLAFTRKGMGSVVIYTFLTDKENINKNLNGISQNDPFYASFLLSFENGIYELDFDKPCLMCKPKNPIMAMHSEVMKNLRKVKGDKNDIIKGFTKFLDKRDAFIKQHKENIFNVAKIDEKYFITN